MLSASEAFKVGFLARCVEDRLSPEEMHARVKQALDMLEKRPLVKTAIAKELWEAGKGITSGLFGWGLPLAVFGPPVLGGVAGYGLAKATDISEEDVRDIKDQEVLDEYQRQTERLQQAKAMRERRRDQSPRGRLFM